MLYIQRREIAYASAALLDGRQWRGCLKTLIEF